MLIRLSTTTLARELAAWRDEGHAVIARPEHWAIRGTTRMGKALTADDRLEAAAIDPSRLAAGSRAADLVMKLLSRADGSEAKWREVDAASSLEFDGLEPRGLELLTSLAYALQAGASLEPAATADEILACAASSPRAAPRANGDFSALLALATETLLVPVALRATWDSPAWVVASLVQLRLDLTALPHALRRGDATGVLLDAQRAAMALAAAAESAGTTRCVRIGG